MEEGEVRISIPGSSTVIITSGRENEWYGR